MYKLSMFNVAGGERNPGKFQELLTPRFHKPPSCSQGDLMIPNCTSSITSHPSGPVQWPGPPAPSPLPIQPPHHARTAAPDAKPAGRTTTQPNAESNWCPGPKPRRSNPAQPLSRLPRSPRSWTTRSQNASRSPVHGRAPSRPDDRRSSVPKI